MEASSWRNGSVGATLPRGYLAVYRSTSTIVRPHLLTSRSRGARSGWPTPSVAALMSSACVRLSRPPLSMWLRNRRAGARPRSGSGRAARRGPPRPQRRRSLAQSAHRAPRGAAGRLAPGSGDPARPGARVKPPTRLAMPKAARGRRFPPQPDRAPVAEGGRRCGPIQPPRAAILLAAEEAFVLE